MGKEENLAFVRRFIDEVVNGHDLSVIDEMVAPNIERHHFGAPGVGSDGVKAFMASFITAFPDLSCEVTQMIADDDRVVMHGVFRGTHDGALWGIPPTGKPIEFEVIDILRIKDGLSIEHWGVTDTMRLMTQIGVVPQRGRA